MIPITHDIQFAFKFKKSVAFLKLTTMEQVKEAETLDDLFIQLNCVTSGVLINPRDEYHFMLIILTQQISFTLSYFLQSLEPTAYRTEVKHVEAKIDRREYKDKDGSPATGKRLCTKVNKLLQDFPIIRSKLDAQRSFAIPRTIERQTKVKGQSQGSLETATAWPSLTMAKPRPLSASTGGRAQRSSLLTSSQSCRPTPGASNLSEVADASIAEAMSKVPLVYESQKKPNFKHINIVYKKFWSECKGAYVFGVDEKKDLSIERLVNAPMQYNIRSKEKKLVDAMVMYLLNLLNRKSRQMLCVMPKDRISKPTSWKENNDGEFYIINR